MSRFVNGLLGWMAGAAAVLALLSGASLMALTALAAVPPEQGLAASSLAADTLNPSVSLPTPGGTLALAVLPESPSAPPVVAIPQTAADTPAVPPARAAVLRDFLVQDCGSCHGLTLGGGLGPPLQRDLLANKPVPYLTYVILNGRPGTAMPPWSGLLTAPEGEWLARELRGENP